MMHEPIFNLGNGRRVKAQRQASPAEFFAL